MSTENMFDNTMQIYLNENGSVKETIDTSFFVANSSEVNRIQCIIPVVMNANKVNVSFKRADGIVISNRVMLSKGVSPTDESLVVYEYTFTQDDRILAIGGNLEISLKVEYITADNRKVWASPIVSAYVRKNIDTSPDISTAEAVYQEVERLTEELQANVNIANTDISRLQIDVLDVKGDIEGLINVDRQTEEQLNQLRNADDDLNNRISAVSENLTDEVSALKNEDTSLNNKFKNLQELIITLTKNLDSSKLNKIFNDIAIANNLADNDYFVINSGSTAYRVTFQKMRELLGGGGGKNHYKGDFLSYEALVEEVPVGESGDYAFVNVGTEMLMYVWDSDGADESYQGMWRETTTGQFVSSTTFANFQERLLNGGYIVNTAKNYDNGDNTAKNIKEKFDELEQDKVVTIELTTEEYMANKITQEHWDALANNKNVVVVFKYAEFTLRWSKGRVIYNDTPTPPAIYTIYLTSMLVPKKFLFQMVEVKSDLTFTFDQTTFLTGTNLQIIKNTTLELLKEDKDSGIVSAASVDLTPPIQKVIDDNITIVDLGLLVPEEGSTSSMIISSITQEQFKKFNGENVILKCKVQMSAEYIVEFSVSKTETLYDAGQPVEYQFNGVVQFYECFVVEINIGADLSLHAKMNPIALANTISVGLNKKELSVGISGGDIAYESKVDLTPAIESVVNDNDTYVVNYNNLKTDPKVLELIRNGKFYNIVVQYNISVAGYTYLNFARITNCRKISNDSCELIGFYKFPYFENVMIEEYSNISIVLKNISFGELAKPIFDNATISSVGDVKIKIYIESESFSLDYRYPNYFLNLNFATLSDIQTGTNVYKSINPKILNEYVASVVKKEKLIINDDNYTNYITFSSSTAEPPIFYLTINNIANKIVEIDFNKNIWSAFSANALSFNGRVIFVIGENCENSEITIFNSDHLNWSNSDYYFANIFGFDFKKRYIVNADTLRNVIGNTLVGIDIDAFGNFKFNDNSENYIEFVADSAQSATGNILNEFVYFLKITEDDKNVEINVSANGIEI